MFETWLPQSSVLWSTCKLHLSHRVIKLIDNRTKIAIKMSKSSTKSKDDVQKDASVSSESEDDEEHTPDASREETPDLYRNSALGMYSGVRSY